MRLHPAVTPNEALAWLTSLATAEWGAGRIHEVSGSLAELADAMAAVSAVELPDDLPPLFPLKAPAEAFLSGSGPSWPASLRWAI